MRTLKIVCFLFGLWSRVPTYSRHRLISHPGLNLFTKRCDAFWTWYVNVILHVMLHANLIAFIYLSINIKMSSAHPWPYLEKLFQFKSIERQTVRLTCLLCQPKVKECSASLSSMSNLRKHVQVSSSVCCLLYMSFLFEFCFNITFVSTIGLW